MKKRLYMATNTEDDFSSTVVAKSIKEAKKITSCSDGFEDCSWINLELKWVNNKNIDFIKLSYGMIDDYDQLNYLLSLSVFSCLYDHECPVCGEDTAVYYDEEGKKFYCTKCESS